MQLTQHVLLLKKVLYLVEIALLRASVTLKTKAWDDSYRYGYNIIQKALRAPIEKILENAGFEPSESINNILQNKNLNWGYNSRTYNYDGTKGYCDMLVEGIIDPVKVTRMAIQNAVSVVDFIITTEATIFDESKKECECSAGAGTGMGMGGGIQWDIKAPYIINTDIFYFCLHYLLCEGIFFKKLMVLLFFLL